LQGCRVTNSASIVQAFASPSEGQAASYPVCSPYVSEDQGTICHFEQMHLVLHDEKVFVACWIARPQSDCPGVATSGPYPWGLYGRDGLGPERDNRDVRFESKWGPGLRDATILFISTNPGSDTGIAHLGGTLPAPDSPALSINDAFATDDDHGYPVGDHFYTPDIPGQRPGEVGGPLYLKFINGSLTDVAEAYIEGYLYLKP
jgi:hypothetical protein